MDNTPVSLVKTKLYRPVVGGDLVRRQRLIDLLDQGCDRPVTLISAPAGSGKTTLVCDWLATCPCPSAWLSLDEGDGDLGVFLSYFVAAVQAVFPNACKELQHLLQTAELAPRHVLAATLINEIDGLRTQDALSSGRRFALVLDDYHLLRSPEVDSLLTDLLRHPPSTLRLLLVTRSDPALPLTVMRARRQVAEIRLQDLRFTSEETIEFLQRALDSPAIEDLAASLEEKTEGWITGLHLASLYLRHSPNPSALVADLELSDRYVMDYLVDEVLVRQAPQVQDFLLSTAVLDRLTAPLCEAVVGLSEPVCDGQAYLEWLEQSNLFIVSLDAQRQWFRYHHLFQQLLQTRLKRRHTEAEIADLHARASAWYARNDFVDEAILHALAAGEEAVAVHLVETHRHEAMNHERWQQLERWLRLMPRRLVAQRPELQLAEAWILQKQWQFLDIVPHVARVESLLETSQLPQPDLLALRGEVDALLGMLYYYQLDGERALASASRALQTLPMASSSARGTAWMYYGAGYQMLGDVKSARSALLEGLKEDKFHGNAFPSRVFLAMCVLAWMTADLGDLSRVAAQWLRIANERNLSESVGWARYFQGCVAYQLNDLAAAERNFAAVVEQRYIAHSFTYSQSAFGLASVYLAKGAGERARAMAESVVAYGLEINNLRVLADAQTFQAWLALKQRRLAEAQRWAESVDPRAPLVPMTTFHVAPISLAQVLLQLKTPAGLRQASDLLARLHAFAASQHNIRFLVEVLALQAMLANASGRRADALRSLTQAVSLAQPGGLVRVFLDLGPELVELLSRLRIEGKVAEFVGHVLRAFHAESGRSVDRDLKASSRTSAVDLAEPLTDREMEILTLLARRLSAKEIAQQLVISDRTVKRHTANIYQKLGVNSRQQAVKAGLASGILASSVLSLVEQSPASPG